MRKKLTIASSILLVISPIITTISCGNKPNTPYETDKDKLSRIVSRVQSNYKTTKTTSLVTDIIASAPINTPLSETQVQFLGVSNLPMQNTEGVVVEYTIINTNISGGVITLKMILSLGSEAPISKTTSISGFLKSTDETADAIAAFPNSIQTNKPSENANSYNINQQYSRLELGIDSSNEPQYSGVTYTYVVKAVNQNSGTLTVEVTARQQLPIISSSKKTITITGYRSPISIANAVWDRYESTYTTTKTNVLAGSIGSVGATVTPADLGFTPPPNTTVASIAYVIKTISNGEAAGSNPTGGEIEVTVNITVDTYTLSNTIRIIGFARPQKPTMDFVDENSMIKNNNVVISRSFFGNWTATQDYNHTYDGTNKYVKGDLISAYIIEISNGVSFVFDTRTFFAGYTFNQVNEDQIIKMKLYSLVNDVLKYANFGIGQAFGYAVVFTGLGGTIANDNSLAYTRTAMLGNRDIAINYTYEQLSTHDEIRDSTKDKASYRNYQNAVTVIVHEIGHMESESSLGLFHDDKVSKYDLSNLPTEPQQGYTQRFTEYDGNEVSNKLLALFNQFGIDMSLIWGNMTFTNGPSWTKYPNDGVFNKPTFDQMDQIVSRVWGKPLNEAFNDVYDTNNAFYATKMNFANSSPLYNGIMEEPASSKEAFRMAGKQSFYESYASKYEANTEYIFNLSESLTRMHMLLSQSGVSNGSDEFAKSFNAQLQNGYNTDRWGDLKDFEASAVGDSMMDQIINRTDALEPVLFWDSMMKEYFNFASVIGVDNVIKIIDNREELLKGWLKVLYGDFNKMTMRGRQILTTTGVYPGNFTLGSIDIYGVTENKDVELSWGNKYNSNWDRKYVIPQVDYKPLVYKVGNNDRVTNNLYWYKSTVNFNLNLDDTFQWTGYWDNVENISWYFRAVNALWVDNLVRFSRPTWTDTQVLGDLNYGNTGRGYKAYMTPTADRSEYLLKGYKS